MTRDDDRRSCGATGDGPPRFYDSQAEVERLHGAHLPHWHQQGATYFVTFRLADSLPQVVLTAWRQRRAEALGATGSDDGSTERAIRSLFCEQIDRHLDAGAGECLLARPGLADLMARALQHFDGDRYRLWAWCVMPNHVHVLVEPVASATLSSILHSWKSSGARAIGQAVGRPGQIWQAESFDHLVRREEAFEHYAGYTAANPGRAGLHDWPWCGVAAL